MPSPEKQIYLIRHAESEGNIGPVRQDTSSPLSPAGQRQAAYMAERCAKLPLEVIVSSTMTRARETATTIQKKIGTPIEESGLFVERLRPSVQHGKPKDAPESLEIDERIRQNFGEGWRHSDEENFDDLKARAEAALQYLANRPEQHVGVVTHGLFMSILLASAVFRETLTGPICRRVTRGFHMQNTGLSLLSFYGNEADPSWVAWVWNDHAHLG
jgi:probable phosphoglycerate mutase